MTSTLRGAIAFALLLGCCPAEAGAANIVTTTHSPVAAVDVKVPAAGFGALKTDSLREYPAPEAALPTYFAPFVEPTFGALVTRIAGDSGTAIGGGVSGTWGADVRHHYSKDQPWNSDGTLLALQNHGGGLLLLDGETYQPRYAECRKYGGDDRWHPSTAHPNERISVKKDELMWFDVVNCVKTRSWTLPFAVKNFGNSEGNPSFDGRFAALTDGARMFVVDMDPQAPFAAYPASRIGPAVDISACGLDSTRSTCAVDWVSVSPSGKYVVVAYFGAFLRVFDIDPATLALTPRAMPLAASRCHGTAELGYIYDLGHADMTMNPFDGNEDVIIGQEHCGNRGKLLEGVRMSGVVMVRLADGKVTPLTNPTREAYPHHISTRNYDRPGWVYVGYHSDPGKKFDDEIIAVKLDGSQSVQRFAHKHSGYKGLYRAEGHSVPSRDGRRVLWASNWALGCSTCGDSSDIKPYIVDARALAPQGSSAIAPHAILADASRSSDSDGRIATYHFDFGDGTKVGPQVSPFASHVYGAGRWTLKMTVTDSSGNRSVATQDIDVSVNTGNRPPVAALTVTPSSGFAPLAVVADASGSRDPDSPIASYRFEFGDGAVETSALPAMPHVYAAGTWAARVIVTDPSGAADTATTVVTVSAPGGGDTTGVNLVGNPSFETGTEGWKAYGNASISRVPNGQDGSWSLAVRGALLGSAFGVNDSPNWVKSVPTAGTKYRITAWVRALGLLGTVKIQVREWQGTKRQGKTVQSKAARLGLQWQKLEVDMTAQTAGSRIDVQIIDTPLLLGETFYVDNVSIVEVGPGKTGAETVAQERAFDEAPAFTVRAPRVMPNPMFRRGSIEFSTAQPGALHVALFDVAGRSVRVLANEPFAPAGPRQLEIDGKDQNGSPLPAGMYFYRVVSSAGQYRGRFVLK